MTSTVSTATDEQTTTTADAVIEIEGLIKRFGSTVALDGLSMSVPTGQIHGFLGPNGSGKSTTIRVLLGLLRPDAGRIRLLGGDPWAQAPELHRRLAYVPGDVSLWPNLTGGEAIDLLGRARGGLNVRRRDELIARFDLDPRKKARSYSKGNRQKVALVAALASDVELLLLDEPTSGLDPLMERAFTDYIRAERHGLTVLLSSHILSEVETLCDHVSIIRAGRIVEGGTLAQLRHLTRTQVVAELAGPAPSGVTAMPGLHDVRVEEHGGVHHLACQVDDTALTPLLSQLATTGVRSLVATPPTLEELFLRHYDERPDAPDGMDPNLTGEEDFAQERGSSSDAVPEARAMGGPSSGGPSTGGVPSGGSPAPDRPGSERR